jgi:hypothetical protein
MIEAFHSWPATPEAALMKKVNRRTARTHAKNAKLGLGKFRESALRVRPRSIVVLFAALACWFALAVGNRAEQVDSGWAVAIPSSIGHGSATPSIEQQIVIRNVLEQTQQPLVTKPPAQAAQTSNQHTAGVRFAVKPDGVDGWRPAGQPISTLGQETGVHLGPPQSASPQAAPAQNPTLQVAAGQVLPAPAKPRSYVEVENDCNGVVRITERAKAEPTPAQQPALSDVNLARPAAAEKIEASGSAESKIDKPQLIEETPHDAAAEAPSANSETSLVDTNANALTPEVTVEVQAQPTQGVQQSQPENATAGGVEAKPQAAAGASAEKAPAVSVTPVAELPPLTKQLMALRTRVRAVLKGYYRKPLSSRENDPWESMHGMLAYGVHSKIHDGGPNGPLITSVGWLCYNKPCKGQTLLYVTPAGELRAKYGVGLQGHLGQFLAMLAQCHVSPDYPIHVAGHEFTIKDLIEAEKKTCYPKSELTFKLIALQHYADLNDKWVNDQGVEWDFPRLVREELEQPIRGAACGGTHRLSGLSLVVKTRIRRGEPLDGEYQRAAEFVKKYQMYAFRLQNRDGSLSTSWFRGAGDDDDINRRIKTTGHILEWLCYSLSDEQLREPQTIRAVTYLANLMYSNYDNEWEIGPRSHATHALLLYDERVFQPFDKDDEVAAYRPTPSKVAKRNTDGTMRR